MKQTAIEWYESEINALFEKYDDKKISKIEFMIMKHNLFYPAKEMEKEQIIDAYDAGQLHFWPDEFLQRGEYYYKETFNTNEK